MRKRSTSHQRRVAGCSPAEWIACGLATLVLLSCLALALGACGGGDFVVGGNAPVVPTAQAATPTEAP